MQINIYGHLLTSSGKLRLTNLIDRLFNGLFSHVQVFVRSRDQDRASMLAMAPTTLSPGGLRIFFDDSPTGRRLYNLPPMLYDKITPGFPVKGFKASGLGTAIVENGYEIAEFVHDQGLFVHLQAHDFGTSTCEILEKVFKQSLSVMASKLSQPPDENIKEAWIKGRVAGSKNQLKPLEDQVNQRKHAVDLKREELAACSRELRSAMADLVGEQIRMKSADHGEDRFALEYTTLIKNPMIMGLEIPQTGKIVVTTDQIYVRNPRTGWLHQIGSIEFTIDFQNAQVILVNKSGLIIGHNHGPHIGDHGNPCWGNVQNQISAMLRSQDALGLINTIIAWLQHVDPADGWGRRIVFWPVVDDKTLVVIYPDGSPDTNNPNWKEGQEIPIPKAATIREQKAAALQDRMAKQ